MLFVCFSLAFVYMFSFACANPNNMSNQQHAFHTHRTNTHIDGTFHRVNIRCPDQGSSQPHFVVVHCYFGPDRAIIATMVHLAHNQFCTNEEAMAAPFRFNDESLSLDHPAPVPMYCTRCAQQISTGVVCNPTGHKACGRCAAQKRSGCTLVSASIRQRSGC